MLPMSPSAHCCLRVHIHWLPPSRAPCLPSAHLLACNPACSPTHLLVPLLLLPTLLPPRCSAPQAMDSSAEDLKTVTQVTGTLQPITKEAPKLEKVAITADMKVGRGWGRAGADGQQCTHQCTAHAARAAVSPRSTQMLHGALAQSQQASPSALQAPAACWQALGEIAAAYAAAQLHHVPACSRGGTAGARAYAILTPRTGCCCGCCRLRARTASCGWSA